ncbi:Exocyst complex component 2 [Brachionus plicatilis]|uniref:Exocyst complex component 2 n=1 Tax=Brachionus plicatilis TaxID=10195 RepID=A0A3M7RWM5_BRAPC|nr:Exocyst complex component 2 [Brachionus plicatilis]
MKNDLMTKKFQKSQNSQKKQTYFTNLNRPDQLLLLCSLNISSLLEILNSAHRIYDDDLECKAHADSIRSSLQILDTYKSLIYFPQQVDKLLLADDYEQITTSYKLAKMQLAKAEPAARKSVLFAQIKRDLDSKVKDVQSHILSRLVQFPSSPDEQKFLIQNYNLIEDSIETKSGSGLDPAWHCLLHEKNWLIQVMIECRDMHIADEKVSMVMKQSNEDKASEAATVHSMSQVPHERNRFIEELCQMFFDIFTDYWRLGAMYLNNVFAGAVTKPAVEYYALVDHILEVFCNIVRAAFIPHTFDKSDKSSGISLEWPIQQDAKIISQILPHCLKVCRMCAQQIYLLEVPRKSFECVEALIYDLRCECLVTLLSQPTRELLATLGFEEEDWIVDRDVDAKNNSCLITNLRYATWILHRIRFGRTYLKKFVPSKSDFRTAWFNATNSMKTDRAAANK